MAYDNGGTPLTLRQHVVRRKSSLYNARSSWETRYQELSRYILPFSGRFQTTERNRGDKSFNAIVDETATFALQINAAGMQAGVTSPARPWFRVGLRDKELMERDSVKIWLANVTDLMRDVFAQGNTYRTLHTMYEELALYGTAVDVVLPDFDYVIWNDTMTAGEYALATDRRGRVNTMVREFEMTVEQIVEEFVMRPGGKFDWSVASVTVKNMWDTHAYDKGVPVIHLIEPRSMAQRGALTRVSRRLPRNMPWASVYIEAGQENKDVTLRESGFQDLPVLAPRWHTRGGDVYGSSPGMSAIGSTKQLQQEQIRKAQGIDQLARPAIALPGTLKGREANLLPGGVNYFDPSAATNGKVSNLYDVRIDLSHLLADIKDVRDRINRHFYADLFMMISNDTRSQRATATEIAERHEEKLLMLGPVLERLHDELLSPLIDITFANLLEAGALPPIPPELENQELKVEFISVLAQAQRAVGLASLDRLIGTIGSVSAASGDVSPWDKLDKDEAIERYADMLAVDPELIISDKNVAMVRESRAKAAQAAQMMAAAPGLASAAKAGAEAQEISAGAPAGSIEQFTGYTP